MPTNRNSLYRLTRCFCCRLEQGTSEGNSVVAEEPSSESTAKKLQLARGISAKSRNSSVALRWIRTIGYWGELWRRNGGESVRPKMPEMPIL